MEYKKAALRPLPSSMPEFIAVKVRQSEFKGRLQWVATYRLYENGCDSDYIDLVVNFNQRRFFRFGPENGEWWWVKPTNMASLKRLIFAEAVDRLDSHDAPLTTRTSDELILPFYFSSENRYESRFDGWKVLLSTKESICQGEAWRVKVREINPVTGVLYTDSVGPDPKAFYRPPAKVGYIGIAPLARGHAAIEADVLSYSRYEYETGNGGRFFVEIERNSKILSLDCSQLRQVGKRLIGSISLRRSNEEGYLAELVLIEGEPCGRPSEIPMAEAPRRESPAPLAYDLDDEESHDDSYEEYLAECRANEERPDWD